MKKLIGVLALLLALGQISFILWFESFGWKLGTMLISFFAMFVVFVQCLSYLISKKGFLQKTISILGGAQLILAVILLSGIVEISILWFWQFSIGLVSICLGMISSSLYKKVNPLVYYLQYMILAIIVFCLLALGMTKISAGTITIGFSLLSLLSATINLLFKEKTV